MAELTQANSERRSVRVVHSETGTDMMSEVVALRKERGHVAGIITSVPVHQQCQKEASPHFGHSFIRFGACEFCSREFVHFNSHGFGATTETGSIVHDGVSDPAWHTAIPVSEPIRPPPVARQCSRYTLRGVRVGEASHPGPVADTFIDSSGFDLTSDGGALRRF